MRNTSYNRGDVILVEITFSGSQGSKRRPAVVLSSEAFNQAGIKLIVAAITSNILPPLRPGDTFINDWRAAGLVKQSAVRGVIATIDKNEIVRKLGIMPRVDFENIEQGIASILELEKS